MEARKSAARNALTFKLERDSRAFTVASQAHNAAEFGACILREYNQDFVTAVIQRLAQSGTNALDLGGKVATIGDRIEDEIDIVSLGTFVRMLLIQQSKYKGASGWDRISIDPKSPFYNMPLYPISAAKMGALRSDTEFEQLLLNQNLTEAEHSRMIVTAKMLHTGEMIMAGHLPFPYDHMAAICGESDYLKSVTDKIGKTSKADNPPRSFMLARILLPELDQTHIDNTKSVNQLRDGLFEQQLQILKDFNKHNGGQVADAVSTFIKTAEQLYKSEKNIVKKDRIYRAAVETARYLNDLSNPAEYAKKVDHLIYLNRTTGLLKPIQILSKTPPITKLFDSMKVILEQKQIAQAANRPRQER